MKEKPLQYINLDVMGVESLPRPNDSDLRNTPLYLITEVLKWVLNPNNYPYTTVDRQDEEILYFNNGLTQHHDYSLFELTDGEGNTHITELEQVDLNNFRMLRGSIPNIQRLRLLPTGQKWGYKHEGNVAHTITNGEYTVIFEPTGNDRPNIIVEGHGNRAEGRFSNTVNNAHSKITNFHALINDDLIYISDFTGTSGSTNSGFISVNDQYLFQDYFHSQSVTIFYRNNLHAVSEVKGVYSTRNLYSKGSDQQVPAYHQESGAIGIEMAPLVARIGATIPYFRVPTGDARSLFIEGNTSRQVRFLHINKSLYFITPVATLKMR